MKDILSRPDIYDSLMLSLTYNTNSIEGSTLTENDTANVIFHNKTLASKSLIEQLEAKNHQSALKYLFDYLNQKKKLNKRISAIPS